VKNRPSSIPYLSYSGIKDNHTRGSVGDFLMRQIKEGSRLSIVSAYFTIYAFEALKEQLLKIEKLQFLFGEPSFILDPHRNENKAFLIDREGLTLQKQLQQKRLAKDCADWIREKVEIKSITKSNFLHGKLYHIDNEVQDIRPDGSKTIYRVPSAIMGSSNFTIKGLGLSNNVNIELNLIVSSLEDTYDFKVWFDQIWQNEELVKDFAAIMVALLPIVSV